MTRVYGTEIIFTSLSTGQCNNNFISIPVRMLSTSIARQLQHGTCRGSFVFLHRCCCSSICCVIQSVNYSKVSFFFSFFFSFSFSSFFLHVYYFKSGKYTLGCPQYHEVWHIHSTSWRSCASQTGGQKWRQSTTAQTNDFLQRKEMLFFLEKEERKQKRILSRDTPNTRYRRRGWWCKPTEANRQDHPANIADGRFRFPSLYSTVDPKQTD